MKKTYLKPSMEVEEIEMQSIIAASGDIHSGGNASDNDITEAGAKPRGIWGDVWYEE